MIEYSAANMRMWSRLGPSGAFGVAAMELAEAYGDFVILSADMSYASGLDRYRAKYPDRHFNIGIAEQNMVGIAAGMANEGLIPFSTTYATFFAMRTADQIKANLGYMRLNVKMVGTLAGFAAGILGPTHMSIEDVAIMRAIPNMTVLCPADCCEIIKAMLAAAEFKGPVYIRLTGTQNMPMIYKSDYDFEIGKAVHLKQGQDVAIFASGSIIENTLKAAEALEEQGISCSVINMHTVKPLDYNAIDAELGKKLIVTVEEHSIIGGLGGALAEYLSEKERTPRLLRIGVEDFYPHAGDYLWQLEQVGLSVPQITNKIKTVYERIAK